MLCLSCEVHPLQVNKLRRYAGDATFCLENVISVMCYVQVGSLLACQPNINYAYVVHVEVSIAMLLKQKVGEKCLSKQCNHDEQLYMSLNKVVKA